MKKSLIVILFSAILFVGCTTNISPNDSQNSSSSSSSSSVASEHLVDFDVETSEGVAELRAKYQGNNTWDYSVLVSAPTPCDESVVEILVQESFPETVVTNVSFNQPSTDTMCIQVIDEQIHPGQVQASEQAKFRVSVK